MANRSDLPRVTYSNVGTDFTPVHDFVDQRIPLFKQQRLGHSWSNMIGGRDDEDGVRYTANSPINRDLVLGEFVAASPSAVERAVTAAKTAFPGWTSRSWKDRVRILRKAADLLNDRKYDLGVACLLEVGKSRMEAIGEAEEAVDLVSYYCDEMERNDGFARPLERAFPQEETRDVTRGIGVFGVIAPFNFPLALSMNMMTGALATGNTVVYKPSPMAGLTGSMLVEILHEAGLPSGVVNLVCGGAEVGSALVDDPRLAGVVFTGSHAVGMAIYRKLAQGSYARPAIVEMGGKNPAYVTAQADLEVAATGVMRSAFGLQGQKCSACSKVYVQHQVYDEFMNLLVDKSRALRVGNPEERDVFMGPLINEQAFQRFQTACRDAEDTGRVVLGGEALSGGLCDKGYYVPPTVIRDMPAEHRLNREELFLPFLSAQGFDSLSEAIADGNSVLYGLTAGIYTEDDNELDIFLTTAEAGALYANRASGATTGAWPGIQSFCGWKGSGVTSKGGLGPYYLPQFMREQSHTIMHKTI